MGFLFQVDGEGVPSDKLTGDAVQACKQIGSAAKTVAEAISDPKVRVRARWKLYTVSRL